MKKSRKGIAGFYRSEVTRNKEQTEKGRTIKIQIQIRGEAWGDLGRLETEVFRCGGTFPFSLETPRRHHRSPTTH
ncbi:hypothetical protein L2E82_41550 [Cichorium intybus]|uniref:Uncharacterized protein n=1 Tax=Cichorium intybus TaxID=13427 RepID=A0ACB9AMI9_CICIN|nr:hypothetical protein L2E82_41550 [Cichorium intybus]